MKQSPLKRTKKLNPASLKRINQMREEVPDRIALCKRAGGTPILGKHTYYIKGIAYPVTTVQCWGGACECGCGERADNYSGKLEPHEKIFRSHMGKLSLDNTIMVIPQHHPKLQNNELHWSKDNPPVVPCLGNMTG